MKILGINGLKTSGKDTIYGIIRNIQAADGYNAQRVAFADKLKIMAMLALGFERPDAELIALADSMKDGAHISVLYDEPGVYEALEPYDRGTADLSTLHDLNGRQYLQNFGNHARRVFGETFWIDQVLPAREHTTAADRRFVLDTDRYGGVDLLIVTDPRYPNEADRIKALGGDIWEVQRPGLVSDGHVTEQPLPEEFIDQTIINDGTLDDLSRKVEAALDVMA